MTVDQEMIEGLKLAAGAGFAIALVFTGLLVAL